ncbi:fungal-specific transcription factor domain-containing protein [Exophiala viscosa]|uniref:fungal-specific transcription factor domain-containing protein n=1 Tax=Exophiala viscosa TaxID=2486360 RepID=UPI00219DD32C|nr:fungal-specific transcription factor domain-containing protein [Exophiala viscosa]
MAEPKRPRLDPSLNASHVHPTFEQSPNTSSVTPGATITVEFTGKRRWGCTYPGCGRNYSRAEHLYRHQLNHNPKEIYKCDYPGCSRTFVRNDLCLRHRERHDNRSKQAVPNQNPGHEPLSPKSSFSDGADTTASHVSNIFATPKPPSNGVVSPEAGRASFSAQSPYRATDLRAIIQQTRPETHVTTQNNGHLRHHSTRNGSHVDAEPTSQYMGQADGRRPAAASPNSSSLIRRPHSLGEVTMENVDPAILNAASTHSNSDLAQQSRDRPSVTYSIPSLGDQPFNDSPVSARDEFTAWLFDDAAGLNTAPFTFTGQPVLGFGNTAEVAGNTIYSNYFADAGLDNVFPELIQQPLGDVPANVTQPSADSSLLSHSKRLSLVTLMRDRFNENDNPFVRGLKEEIFQGNMDADEHVLSIRSMQHYIGSYWYHFHAQLPILHQPTFSAENIHEYLLLAIMAIGAANLNKAHGRLVTDAASRLAMFIAWHLRWQVFMHSNFHPPAELWVLQTLLLLEAYEKMNATRMLHERAHIHHATTINLMRRGTALIESAHQDSARVPSTPDEWWSRWITAEATRRAAFAAFYLDAVHATMFGHAAMMVVHEIRLPLPCDDALWSATSAAEVGRVESSLHANGIKPTTFLDGLKKTLTGRKVRTNTFGRMILMAGLLSVSWHMHQRDLQVSSIGVTQSMGVPDGWRSPLTKAVECWKKDFDENAEHMRRATLPWQQEAASNGQDDMTTTADVLYHLSNMAMHVECWDCQIFAGIKRLFGRKVTKPEYDRAKAKIFDWCRGPGAKVAVYHALQLLRLVLLPDRDGSRKPYNARDDYLLMRPWASYYAALVVWSYGFAMDGVLRAFPSLLQTAPSPGTGANTSHGSGTSMLNMAHDGSEIQIEVAARNAEGFLQTVGAIKSPQQLDSVKDGRNNVVGVLAVLEAAFRDSRWELLHEAAELLRNAITLLRGADR